MKEEMVGVESGEKAKIELPKKTVSDVIEQLKKEPLTLETIMDVSEAKFILGRWGILQVTDEAQSRFEKWLAKRGKNLSPRQQERMRRALFMNVAVERIVREVCGYYGIAGAQRLEYMNLARKIYKEIARRDPRDWPSRLKNILDFWRRDRKINREIGHVVVLLAAKISYDVLYRERFGK